MKCQELNNKKKLCVLILQYNSPDLTIQLLGSIVKYEKENLNKYRFIVMDNASKDSKKDEIVSKFPFIEFVQYEQNLGFARAHNKIFPKIKEPWILLLNNDCILLNDAITKTLEAAEKKGADFATCALYNEDGTPQINFSVTPTPLRRIFLNLSEINRLFLQKIRLKLKSCRVGYINGAFLLIRKSSLPGGYLFDNKYFMYTEDFDLMLRFHKDRKKGYRFANGKVIHLGGGSARRKWTDSVIEYMKLKDTVECMEKYFPKWQVTLWFVLWKLANFIIKIKK